MDQRELGQAWSLSLLGKFTIGVELIPDSSTSNLCSTSPPIPYLLDAILPLSCQGSSISEEEGILLLSLVLLCKSSCILTKYMLTIRNPWLLYKSSATFGNYLGAYGVLLSCIAGPMIADYWIVRRGHYRVNDLYTLDQEGWYWYTAGINWRAFAAYIW